MNAILALAILSVAYPSLETGSVPSPARTLFPGSAAADGAGKSRRRTAPPPAVPSCVSTRLCTGADGRTALLVRADPPKRCDLPTLVEGFGRSISSRPITAAKAGNVPPPATGRVAINTASLAELEGLPGVGPGRARRIVEARAREPFKRIGDLRRVPGFGVKTLRRLKDLVEF